MGLISRQIVNFYKKTTFKRRDDDGSLFYFKSSDFNGLLSERFCFKTSKGNSLPTLANAVMAFYGGDFVFRAVSRLDRDTSGIVVIAKDQITAAALSEHITESLPSGSVLSCSGVAIIPPP